MPIAVALMRNSKGEVLLVRKQGTTAFMQPGGKIEPGEDARTALTRELWEELQVSVSPERLHYLGQAEAWAANEPGVMVVADIFEIITEAQMVVRAEIAEAVWVDASAPLDLILAPLTRDHILPLVSA